MNDWESVDAEFQDRSQRFALGWMRHWKRRVVLIVALVLAVSVGTWAFTYFTAETRGRVDLHNQQRSAAELQASYEFFHDTCRAVIAQTQQVDALQQNLDSLRVNAPASDPFGQYAVQVAQVQTQVTGLENVRASTAQDYNAKSHEFTHNFMRSRDLPDEIGPPNGVSYSALRCENGAGQ